MEKIIAGSDGFKVPFHSRVVETKLGKVHGGCSHAACQWLNVPFAEPFSRRFEVSQIRETPYNNEGVGSATEYGPACIQNFRVGNVGRQSEDCMNLNIFAPSGYADMKPLPVMIWVMVELSYGWRRRLFWSYVQWDSSRYAWCSCCDSAVQGRYFWFLQQPDGTGGANGFGDMISALKWVQSHIASFNGNLGR